MSLNFKNWRIVCLQFLSFLIEMNTNFSPIVIRTPGRTSQSDDPPPPFTYTPISTYNDNAQLTNHPPNIHLSVSRYVHHKKRAYMEEVRHTNTCLVQKIPRSRMFPRYLPFPPGLRAGFDSAFCLRVAPLGGG